MNKKITVSVIAFLIICLSVLCCFASVEYSPEATGGETVYIAGNPDLYPVEYYDSESKTYKGILPDVYAEISKSTGLNFTYIRTGSENEQNRIAVNNQADIISAHIKGDVSDISDEISLMSFNNNGEKLEICIGFTNIADDNTKKLVKNAISKIPDSELLSYSLQATILPEKNVSIRLLIILISVLSVALLVFIIIAIKNKIKSKKLMQTKLTDTLTGIGNEKYFEQNYRHYITPSTFSLYYIIYFSINMQKIEKYFGTTEAEQIELYAANILSSSAGDLDFTARIGSGVFLCAYQSPSDEEMSKTITELLGKLNAYKETFLEEFHTYFRAGIFHPDSANIPFETAVLNARESYFFAHQNKLPYQFSTKDFLEKQETKSKQQKKLADAIKNNEIKLYLQFIVDAKTGVIKGAEALSRWHNPEDGILLPDSYVNAMTSAGIIEHLDFYIFEKVCSQLEEWSDTDKKDLWISCNFTRATVSKSNFFERFKEIQNKYSFEHDKLIIELTEDSLADNKEVVFQNILSCKKLGFKIALDDLGSGYSSFRDLCDFPIDLIKIDRHIVAKSVTRRGNALLAGIIKLCHDLGMKVLCEGVESEKENTNSINADCDYIQGYYYSHVLPYEESDTFLLKSKHF